MIELVHGIENGKISLSDNGDVHVTGISDDFLLHVLEQEFSKGVLFLRKFKQEGIPGKIKAFRKIESDDDIICILQIIKEHYPNFDIEICYREKEPPNQKRYTFLRWNGEYGAPAKFIVRDNWKGRQSLFIPGRCNDLFWFSSDLAHDNAVSNWEEFGEESVGDLEPIAFF